MELFIHVFLHLLVLRFCFATILEGPVDTVYRNGVDKTGSLTCKLSLPVNQNVLWHAKNLGVVNNGDLSFYNDSYGFTSDTATGVFTMTFRKLNRSVSGEYKCQYKTFILKAQVTVAGKSTFCYLLTNRLFIILKIQKSKQG